MKHDLQIGINNETMKRVVKRSSAVQLTVILNNQRSVSVPQEYHIHKISRLQLII